MDSRLGSSTWATQGLAPCAGGGLCIGSRDNDVNNRLVDCTAVEWTEAEYHPAMVMATRSPVGDRVLAALSCKTGGSRN